MHGIYSPTCTAWGLCCRPGPVRCVAWVWRRPVQGCQTAIFESSPFGFSKQFDVVHHQIWVSRDDCDQKNGMFLHRNEKLRSPVIREMSGQTPRGTFNRLEFWNAAPPGHLMKTLCQMWYLQHTGTGFIGNAYLLRLYESIKVHTHTNPGRGLSCSYSCTT